MKKVDGMTMASPTGRGRSESDPLRFVTGLSRKIPRPVSPPLLSPLDPSRGLMKIYMKTFFDRIPDYPRGKTDEGWKKGITIF